MMFALIQFIRGEIKQEVGRVSKKMSDAPACAFVCTSHRARTSM